jgi:hypothetical protein
LSCCLNSKRVQVGVVKFSTSFIWKMEAY